MELTVNSATIQFGEGKTVGLLIGFSNYERSENLNGNIQVPLSEVGDMQYDTLAKAVKKEIVTRLSET
ncbi:hypothetical protein [Enterococcus sp. AZ102]|uniref:hypothetical protein n=1 Tax=Enterococcus sp. AZ102 TaxID=2774865 RepID=UPI003F21D87E